MKHSLVLLTTVLLANVAAFAAPKVEVEEVITRTEPADNGAGPLWCYGSPLIVRDGENVYASIIETGKDVPPLCNTRWQLWGRNSDGWRLVQAEQEFRQREPCPLAVLPGGLLYLSANPSMQPAGTKYGPCRPTLFEFNLNNLAVSPTPLAPAWAEGTQFTDHSYRGFAADRDGRELLALNIHAGTGDQFVSLRARDGKWLARGTIHFPIRSCYPQVGLARRAAHVMAIGDIVEPNEEWRKLKKEVLKQDWDYVFRRLFYAWSADISTKPFGVPIEIDSVEATGGSISNCDLHVDETGACHLLYIRRPHQYEFLRDKYFPGQPMISQLVHVTVKEGRAGKPQVLAETPQSGDGLEPGFARFHALADGRLCVVVSGTPREAGKPAQYGNFIAALGNGRPAFERIALEHPFGTFFTNTARGGSAPSDTLDLFGIADDGPNLRYARVRLR